MLAATPAYAGHDRIAVLATPQVERDGLVDLLTVALAGAPDLQLVERQEVAAAIRELELAAAFGPDAAGQRLRLGRILGADLLLLLATEDDEEVHYLRLVVADATVGARLALTRFEQTGRRPDEFVELIITVVREIRQRYSDGVRQIVAVPPFISRSLIRDLDHLQPRLAHVLEEAFMGLPGTAVLEVEEARAIQRELALAGTTLGRRPVPWIVQGDYRLEGTLEQAGAELRLRLTLSDGDESRRDVERAFASVDTLVRYLREGALHELVEERASAAPIPAARQIEQMNQRAATLETLGEVDLANEIREACLLIDADDLLTIKALIASFARRVGAEPRPHWYKRPTEEVGELWTRYPAEWRRALALLQHSIERRLVGQLEVLELDIALAEAMERFAFFGPDDPPQTFSVHDPALLSLFDGEMAQCTQLHRAHYRDIYPKVAELPVGEPSPEFRSYCYNSNTAPASGPPGLWYLRLFEFPTYRRHSFDRMCPHEAVAPALLDHYLHVLTTQARVPLGKMDLVVPMLRRYVSEPPECHKTTPEQFLAFTDALRASADPLNQAYGELGRLLYRWYADRGEEAAARAELTPTAAQVEQEFRRLTGTAPERLVQLRRELATLEAPKKEHTVWPDDDANALLELSAQVPSAPTHALRLEQLHFRVRLRDGREVPFDGLQWADQPGFVTDWGAPVGVVRAGADFDVFWNGNYVLVQREPGRLDEVLLDRTAGLRSVAWDGTYIWAASPTGYLAVFDAAGTRVQTVDARCGLPPCDRTIRLYPLSPGRVFASGAFSDTCRAWCANVEVREGTPRVDVFFEATEVDDHPRDQVHEWEDLDPQEHVHATFIPHRVYAYSSPLDSGQRRLIIDRGSPTEQRILQLLVDPEQRTVEVADFIPADGHTHDWYERYACFLPNGDWLIPRQCRIKHFAPRGRLLADGTREETLAADVDAWYWDQTVVYDGYIYVPSRTHWVRMDLETLAVERLGSLPPITPMGGEGRFLGVSAHCGLLYWTEAGKFYKLLVEPHTPQPAETTGELVREVRVVDAETGQPIADARVTIDSFAQTQDVAVSGEGGAALPTPGATVTVTARAQGYEPGYVVLHEGAHANAVAGSLSIALRPLLMLGGRVLSKDGEPLAGVRVHAIRSHDDPNREIRLQSPETADDGRWQLRLLHTDPAGLRIEVIGAGQAEDKQLDLALPGTLATLRNGTHVTYLRSTPVMPMHVRSSPERFRRGADPFCWPHDASRGEVYVMDVNSRPVAGAELLSSPAGASSVPQSIGHTDENGLCLCTQPICGAVLVRASGFGPCVEEITRLNAWDSNRHTIGLQPATPLAGRVVDERDRPLADVEVTCSCATVPNLFTQTFETDGEGRFSWSDAPTGDVEWSTAKPGYVPVKGTVYRPTSDQVVLHMRSIVTVHVFGTVTNQATGDPITQCQGAIALWYVPHAGQRPMEPQSFLGGHYDFYMTDPPDAGRLQITASGFVPAVVDLDLSSGPEIEIPIALRPHGGLRVRVQWPDGTAAVGSEVVRTYAIHIPSLSLRSQHREVAEALSDAIGETLFPPWQGQCVVSAANEQGFGMACVEEDAEQVTLTLGPWARIEAQWEPTLHDLVPVTLKLESPTQWKGGPSVCSDLTATVDDSGRAVFARVVPGTYAVYREIERPKGTLLRSRCRMVTVQAGECAQVRFERAGRCVTGQLVPPSACTFDSDQLWGQLYLFSRTAPAEDEPELDPTERHCWECQHRPNYHPIFDDDGCFMVDDARPGLYRLEISGHVIGPKGLVRVHLERQDIVVPPCPEDAESTEVDLGVLPLLEQSQRPTMPHRRPLPGPPSEQDSSTTPERSAAGALSVVGLFVGQRRRVNRSKIARLILPVFALVAATSRAQAHDDANLRVAVRNAQSLVRAVQSFQQHCGLWPERLEDLTPRFLNAAPTGCEYHWSRSGYVHVLWPSVNRLAATGGAGPPQTGDRDAQLAFVFNGDERGWYAGRPGSYARIDAAAPAPAGPAPAYVDLLRAAVAEFDRRIARTPDEPMHRWAKVAFLHKAGEFDEARRAALDWVARDPRTAIPRYALIEIERAQRSGLPCRWWPNEVQAAVFDDWKRRDFGSYAAWRVYADPSTGEPGANRLAEFLQGPLCSDSTEWLYAELFLFNDAESACLSRDTTELRTLCTAWRQTAERMSGVPVDRSYHAFLAAAYLKDGDFAAAQAEVEKAVEYYRANQAWADARPLQSAIEHRQRDFDFQPDWPARSEQLWHLELNCPPPTR